MGVWFLKAGWLVVCCWLGVAWCRSCPWEEEGLAKWSKASTWRAAAGVPVNNSQVTIPTGMRVLLDIQPAYLATLTIESGAALIWDDVDDLELNTHYIWVKGEFHMGSKTCRLKRRARIRLHGDPLDTLKVDDHGFGRKFIGVAPNGTLEIHGKLKTSWTKLAQTIVPIDEVDCAMVYNHTSPTHNKAGLYNQNGLNVIVWNEDGSQMDSNAFKDYSAFSSFFITVPKGKVVGLFTHGNDGIKTKTQSLLDTIGYLGGTVIQSIRNDEGYSFIGKKGYSGTVKEVIRKDNSEDGEERGFLSYHDETRGLVFQVAVNPGTVKALQMFRVVNAEALYPKLTLVDEVKGWMKDDEVLLTSTDFDWTQAEVRKIVRCDNCTFRQIRLNESLTYMHYGNFTQKVDERGEVAMLSRAIVIEGVMESSCTDRTTVATEKKLCKKFNRDTFGGHLMVVRGFASVHIRGVQLLHMGQQENMGAYPLHFHMCDNAKGAYLRENTVLDSFSRCFTVHGTDYLEVSDNVCFKHLGHGLFLEDAVEQNNTVSGNLIAGTMHGTLLLSDQLKEWCKKSEEGYCDALSSFWLTHPNNNITNNVAAGGDGIGYMYVFADAPLGPSFDRQKELNRTHDPKRFPLHFSGNVAHSNKDTGVHMDEKISTGRGLEKRGNITENAILRIENEYDPHLNGVPVWAEMSNGTYYKNKMKNMWIKGGNVRIAFSALADSKEGFTGGTTLLNSGTELYKCIFIGETDNTGNVRKKKVAGVLLSMNRSYAGEPNCSLTAVSSYQGPNFINSCFFDKYSTVSWCLDENVTLSACDSSKIVTRHSGALSFKRKNTYPTMTSSYAVNNSFGFCDNTNGGHWVFQGANSLSDWEWRDGNRGVYLRDKDGKLTGTVNASIVSNFSLHSGHECLLRADWGDLLVCPYRYVKMEILGSGGNLAQGKKDKYPLIIKRDDHPFNHSFLHMGEIRNEFLLRTNRSYILDFNNTLSNAAFPSEIKVMGYGVEKGDIIRVGICQPLDVTGFEISMAYPVCIKNNATWVTSLAALDADNTGAAFYHDKTNGILFFKMLSFHQDTNDTQQCPAGKCWKVTIKPVGGTRTQMRLCGNIHTIASFQGSLGTPKKPKIKKCPGIATPEGLGSVDWNNVGFIEHREYAVPCKAFDPYQGRTTPKFKGCYKEKVNQEEQSLKSNEELVYYQTMTATYCVDRCYFRNYQYAGLSRGFRCTCCNTLLTSTGFKVADENCNVSCRGDANEKCGSDSDISVWNTGKA